MQMNGFSIKSFHSSGDSQTILSDVQSFLSELKNEYTEKKDFQLVHALILDKEMHENEIFQFNEGLGRIYQSLGFSVLGGDTSSGHELGIFLSTIIY